MIKNFTLILIVILALSACGGSAPAPTAAPTNAPTVASNAAPTNAPIAQANAAPTNIPAPTRAQSAAPTQAPQAESLQVNGDAQLCAACADTNAVLNTLAPNTPPSEYKSVGDPNHSIVDAVMTTGVEGEKNIPVDNVSDFDPNIPTLYAVVSTKNTAPGSIISVRWIAVDVPGEKPDTFITSSQIQVEGDVNIAFSLSREAAQPWASGAFRIEVYEDNEFDGTLDFTIGGASTQTPSQPTNEPAIERVVTYQNLDAQGEPIDVKGEFPADTTALRAAVYVKTNAPVSVKGVWTAVNAQGVPANQILDENQVGADQENNILSFSIATQNGAPLPQGAYKLDLYIADKLLNTTAFRVNGAATQPTQPTPPAQPSAAQQFTYQGKLDVTPAWNAPGALALAPNGDLYVAESGAVRRVKQDLASVRFGESSFTQGDGKLGAAVTGIAADSQSNIWVANPLHSNIQKFSADGKFLLRFPGDDSQTYDKDGEVNQAYGVAVDKQDNVYVADTLNNRIQKFDANGKFLAKWTTLGLKSPIGITTDAQGNVYVTDTGNHRVLKLDPQGKLVMQFGQAGAGDGEFNGPWGIALDAAGNIFVTDNFNQRVQVFDAQGKFLTKFGGKGSAAGQFNKPVGILRAPSGNVYVADGGNNTVQIFAAASTGANPPGGPSSATSEGRMVADLGFRPNQDGFSFENYGGTYPKEQSDLFVEDLIRMFGEQAVCAGYQDQVCQVAPGALEFADEWNASSNQGHCYGFAVLSLLLFQGKETPQQFGATRVADLKYENQNLQRALMYYFAWQGVNPVQRTLDNSLRQTPNQVLDAVIAGIKNNDPVALGIIQRTGPNRGGHAVTPYAVQDKGNGLYYVWIYDNNYPGQERYIEIDRTANTWKYGSAATNPAQDPNPWGGGATDRSIAAIPVSLNQGRGECLWCNVIGSATSKPLTRLALHGGGNMLLTNSRGQRIGWLDSEFINEIPGAEDYIVLGGLGQPDIPIYTVPADDTYDVQLTGNALSADAKSQLYVFGGGKSLNIDNITLAADAINTLTLGENLTAFNYAPEATENPLITLTLDGAQADYYFAFDELEIDAGSFLKFAFDETDETLALVSDNGFGSNDTFGLTLRRVGNDGTQIYKNDSISLNQSNTQSINYGAWDGKENLEIGGN